METRRAIELEKSMVVANLLGKILGELQQSSLRLAPLMYPSFKAPIPMEKRSQIYDTLILSLKEFMKLPDLVNDLLDRDEKEAVKTVIWVWVGIIVELLRVWDDLSEGIVGVSELVYSSEKSEKKEEDFASSNEGKQPQRTERIVKKMEQTEEEGIIIGGKVRSTRKSSDSHPGKTTPRRRGNK